MTGRQAYYFLGRLLGGDDPAPRRGGTLAHWIASGRVSWERLVEVSSRHLVTPALLPAFDQNGLQIPDDLREFLTDLRDLNAQRNEALSVQIEEIGRALNELGIEPVLLKGAAHLSSGLYGHPGDRVLGDLDILIPAEAARDCYLALVKIGYQGYFQTNPGDPYHDHHHLPPLEHHGRKAAVELHLEPVNKRYWDVLSAAEMRADSTALATATARLRRPSLTHQVIQNILHCQSTRRHYPLRARRIPLRHLHDQTLIRRAAGEGIDWPGIRDRFDRAGQGRALRIHLALAERFFDRPRPEGFGLSLRDRAAKAWFLGWPLRG
ncbi:MAG: nucleotidyltransferase family protein [Proteobacteria bacterium]|nr:nucleotidyltransferase family protein [Pseudomonadota bacterium]MBU1743078.1 nucleotidyltransferase family protein [Pseudomonadota bacterium]